MKTIEKTITIDAPVEKIYGFVDDPIHFPELWPSLVEVTDVELLPKGGHRFHYLYKMAGARFEGITETIERKLNEKLVDHAKGELEGTFKWFFFPEGTKTKVGLEIEYDVPGKLVEQFGETFLVKTNEGEAELMLQNLKRRMEL